MADYFPVRLEDGSISLVDEEGNHAPPHLVEWFLRREAQDAIDRLKAQEEVEKPRPLPPYGVWGA